MCRISNWILLRKKNNIQLMTYKIKVVITLKLQIYIVHWYHAHLFHNVLDRTEVVIYQHLYWDGIRKYFQEEFNNSDIFQCTKHSIKNLYISG